MTATASTEIDVLDFEPAGSESPWMGEVGDLQLASWDGMSVEGVLARGDLWEVRRDAVVVVAGIPFDAWPAEPAGVRTLTLPRAVLVEAGCDTNIPAVLVLEHDRPLVAVLAMVLDEVRTRVPAMSASEVESTRGVLVMLTAGAIRAESGPATPRSGLSGLHAKIEDWINENLRSGPIHVEALAAAHNVSVRTIHRAFSLTGDTMTAVVRARRLAAVREDLVHTDMTIATIARRWSYYDPSHLGREFRGRFGVSPSEYRESHGC